MFIERNPRELFSILLAVLIIVFISGACLALPAIDIRNSTIECSLEFLLNAQNGDGGWGYGFRDGASNVRATARAISVLSLVGDYEEIDEGLSWLSSRKTGAGGWPLTSEGFPKSEPTALAILAYSRAGAGNDEDVRDALDYLRLPSLYWRIKPRQAAYVLWALSERKMADDDDLEKDAVKTILKFQTDEGGFASFDRPGEPDVLTTALACIALIKHDRKTYEDVIGRAIRWLERSQRADGSWSGTNIIQTTALAIEAIYLWEGESESVDRGVRFLLSSMNEDCSWRDVGDEIFTTATVLEALVTISGFEKKAKMVEETGGAELSSGEEIIGTFALFYNDFTIRNLSSLSFKPLEFLTEGSRIGVILRVSYENESTTIKIMEGEFGYFDLGGSCWKLYANRVKGSLTLRITLYSVGEKFCSNATSRRLEYLLNETALEQRAEKSIAEMESEKNETSSQRISTENQTQLAEEELERKSGEKNESLERIEEKRGRETPMGMRLAASVLLATIFILALVLAVKEGGFRKWRGGRGKG